MQPREKLATLLWPESDEDKGRAMLRNTLAYLRGSLSETGARPKSDHLRVERGSLGFDFASRFTTDLDTVEEASKYAQAPVAEQLQGEGRRRAIEALQIGAEACRGEFLEGFSLGDVPDFEYWVELQRELWRGRVDGIFDRLSRLRAEGGESQAALDAAARWVSLNPLNERAHRRLMEARVATGDRAGALSAYETLGSVLAQELDARPGPETEALAARIRIDSAGPVPKRAPKTPASGRAKFDIPLVGRAQEFGALCAEYYAARDSQTRAVAVIGEAGIGKTRLAEEFMVWARSQGADVLRGGAFETGKGLPYGLLVSAIRPRVERERAPDDLLPDVWLAELSRLLPELHERYPDLPTPTADETTARARLFEAVTRSVGALGERAPLAIFLDDLQWADAASREMLHYACRRWGEREVPLLLVVSLRTEASEPDPEGFGWLSALDRDVPLTHLTLDSLPAEDTVRVARALTGPSLESGTGSPDLLRTPADGAEASEEGDAGGAADRLGRWLFEETGGQPLFLVETIKSLIDKGALAKRSRPDGGWGIEMGRRSVDVKALRGLLPPKVRYVIRSRLSRLDRPSTDLIAASAVLGSGFTFDTLRRVARLEEDVALGAMDEILTRQIVAEGGGDAGRRGEVSYGFTHDKIRDVAYTEAGETKRKVYHRRAFEALAEDGAPAAELARHALAAGLYGAAIRQLLSAGDEAMELFAARDAMACYERARSLLAEWTGEGDLSAAEIEHLYVNLGRALELAEEWERARASYEAMRNYAQEAGEPRLEWVALNRLAILFAQRSFDLPAATSLLQEALKVAGGVADRAMLAETEWNLAQMACFAWDPDAALGHGRRARRLAEELRLPELAARGLYAIGDAYCFAGRWDECVAHIEEAREAYATIADRASDVGTLPAQYTWAGSPPSGPLYLRAMEALCWWQLAEGQVNRGEPRAGRRAARAALDISMEINNGWARTMSTMNLAHALSEVGECGEAILLAREAVAMARELPNPTVLLFTLAVLGNAYQAVLGLDDARAAYLEVLALAEEIRVPPYKSFSISRLVANRALADDWEGAHAYALESLANRNAIPAQLIVMDFARDHEVEALLRGGDEELAREDLRRYDAQLGSNRRFRIPHLRARASLCRWDGRTEEAVRHLQQAAALAEEMGLPGESWQSRAALSELFEELGESGKAKEASIGVVTSIESLVYGLADEELRANFLKTLKVSHLFGLAEYDRRGLAEKA